LTDRVHGLAAKTRGGSKGLRFLVALARTIVAIFLVQRERETGTGDEIQWLAKLGYDEGIHLSKDYSMEET
jgi:hypothetical protein